MPRPLFASVAVFATAALAACDAGGPSSEAQVNFNVASRPAQPAPASAALVSASTSDTVTDGTNTLVIDRVQLVLREIELKRVEATAGCGDSGPDDCERLELGPILLDLPLGAGLAHSFSVPVSAGSYDAVEFEIHTPSDDDASDAAFVQAHPDFAGVSVEVDGTFNGVEFSFSSDLNAEEEVELSAPLVITESTAADLTLMVDVDRWFLDGAGILVNPATAGVGLVNESLVESNIRATLRAFEDEDHDGTEDHQNGGDDGSSHD